MRKGMGIRGYPLFAAATLSSDANVGPLLWHALGARLWTWLLLLLLIVFVVVMAAAVVVVPHR